MSCFAGLDVSLEETSICIVDAEGSILRELKTTTDADALRTVLLPYSDQLERIGIEAGPFAQHLYSELTDAGLPAICVESRHMAQALRAQTLNKTDRNDARGIAQMMRVGLFKVVHVKTERSQRLKVLLTARKLLKSKLLDIEADLRGVLKNFGLSSERSRRVTSRSVSANWRPLIPSLPRLSNRC